MLCPVATRLFLATLGVKIRTMTKALDTLILSSVSERYQKVAKVIRLVSERAAEETRFEAIAERIRGLVAEGKLQGSGDLTRWTNSEVRKSD